jgi:hypothetical protein
MDYRDFVLYNLGAHYTQDFAGIPEEVFVQMLPVFQIQEESLRQTEQC